MNIIFVFAPLLLLIAVASSYYSYVCWMRFLKAAIHLAWEEFLLAGVQIWILTVISGASWYGFGVLAVRSFGGVPWN